MADKVQLDIAVNSASVPTANDALVTLGNTAKKVTGDLGGFTQETNKANEAIGKTQTASQVMAQRVAAAQKEIREMANAVGVLNGPLGGISGRMNQLASLFDKVTPQMALFTATMIGVTGAVAVLGPAIIKAADAYNILQARIRNATSSTGDYIGVSNALNQIVKTTGSSLEVQVGAFARMEQAAQTLGRSNSAILTVQKTISELGTMSNLSESKMREVFSALSRGFESGTIRGREFTSTLRNLPSLISLVSDTTNTSVLKLITQAKLGKISAQEFFDAIAKGADQVDQKFKDFPLSIEKAKTSMENSFAQMAAAIDKTFNLSGNTSGLFLALGNSFDFVREHLDEVIVSLTAFSVLMALINFESIITALGYVGVAFKAFGDLMGWEAIQASLMSAATSVSFAEMAAAVELSVEGMVASIFSFNTAAQVAFVDSIGTTVMSAINNLKTGIVTLTTSMVEGVLVGESAQVLMVPLGAGLSSLWGWVVKLAQAFVGLSAAMLLNPWTYVVAGIAAVSVAILNLKKQAEENTKIHVTWGDTMAGIWKALADDTTERVNRIKDKLGEWWDSIKYGNSLFGMAASGAQDFFQGVINWAQQSLPALQKVIDKIEIIHAPMLQAQKLYKEAEIDVENAAGMRVKNELAKRVGYTGPIPNVYDHSEKGDADAQAFYNDPKIKPILQMLNKKHMTIQDYLDGAASPSDLAPPEQHAPPKPDKAAESNAKKVAKLTDNIMRAYQASQKELLDSATKSPNTIFLEQLYAKAAQQVDGKHLTMDQDSRNSLIQHAYQASLNKADTKVNEQITGIHIATNQSRQMEQAIGDPDKVAALNKEITINNELMKIHGSEVARAAAKVALSKEYDQKAATALEESSNAYAQSFAAQDRLNEAKTQGVLALRAQEVEERAHATAMADTTRKTIEEKKALEDLLILQAKKDATANLTADENKIKLEISQTNDLMEALKQGPDAYRKTKMEIDAYNQAMANSNAETPEQIEQLKAVIKMQEEQALQYEKVAQKMSTLMQEGQDLGNTLGNSFNDILFSGKSLGDIFKSLAIDIAKLIVQYQILIPLQQAAFGNPATGTGGAFGSFLGSIFGNGGAPVPGQAVGGAASALEDTATVLEAIPGYARGGVFGPGGVHAFAQGGIVNSPHIFPFANGTGLMGEAGPESIMPLKRMANGNLGIQAQVPPSGGSVMMAPTININVTGGGGSEEQNQDLANKLSATMKQELEAMMIGVIRDQQRPGNLLNQGTNYN